MIIRSKAPLRLGLAGGGTDVSPYSDEHGGYILNVTINMYAKSSIVPINEKKIIIQSFDKNESIELKLENKLPINGTADLVKGVYNRIVQDFGVINTGFKITTHVDAPAGSGLGSSSTLCVAIIGAFAEWLQLPLGEYDIAHLAYVIERIDLAWEGGKQDQYAATFGGFNFMEFYNNDKVIVNPLRIKQRYVEEIQNNLVLYYSGQSRESAKIIKTQSNNIVSGNLENLEATHQVKALALQMKEAILKGEINKIGQILDQSWQQKKKMAQGISNSSIDQIYIAAMDAGAAGGKISGAGGGGFMLFYCPENTKFKVIETLQKLQGQLYPIEVAKEGLYTYTIDG